MSATRVCLRWLVCVGRNKGKLPQVGLIICDMIVAAFSIAWPIIIASHHAGVLSFLYLLPAGRREPASADI